MAAKQFFLPYQNATISGLAEPGARVYFYVTGTTTPQNVFTTAALTVPLANPVISNGAGHFVPIYMDSTLTYRVVVTDRLGAVLEDMDPYIPGLQGYELGYATRALMAAVASPINKQIAYLGETGREGRFVFSTANLTTSVTADTAQGIYVAPTSDTTGASGAWVRKFSGNLDASWFGLSTAATGAANKAALDAAIAYHLSSGIPLELPAGTFNHTGALRVDADYFNIQGSNWGKTILKPTSATEGIILNGNYGRLARIGVDGSVAGTYGIVVRDCSGGVIEQCTARSFDNDGMLFDPSYGGGAAGNNDCLRVVGGEYNSNGGCGVRMLPAADNNNIRFYGVVANGNTSHGFLTRGHGGSTDPACLAEGNGGYGLLSGEDGDADYTTGWRIEALWTEGNTLGSIRGSAISVDNEIIFKAVAGTYGYSRHATSFNSVSVITTGLTRFGSNDGTGFVQASGSASDVYLLAAHATGGNTNLNIGGTGTGIVKSSTAVSATSELKVTGAPGTARYMRWQTSGADVAYIALGGSNVDLFYHAPALGSHTFEIDATQIADIRSTGLNLANGTGLLFNATPITSTVNGRILAAGFPILTGDVTTAGGSLATTIAANAVVTAKILDANVTYAKIQNVAASRLLGNPTGGAAAPSEVSLSADLAFSGTNLQVGAFTGDITKAAGSLATTVGNATISFAKMANLAATSIIGNNTGGAATPVAITLAGGLSFSGTTITPTAGALLPASVAATGVITSSGATSGIGYATGAGGTVTQLTNKSTGVTLNKTCGQITMNNAALLASTDVDFVLTNSAIAATDLLVLNHVSGGTGGSYSLNPRCAAGSATINVRNVSLGSLSEAIVIGFAVIKGATA